MGDFPNPQVIGPVVSTESIYSQGGYMFSHTINSLASATGGTANSGVFIPFALPCPFVVRSLFLYNGTAASGNIDLGVYAQDGTLILSTGSTAQSGTSTLQIITVTERWLAPGAYYMAAAFSLGAATFFRHSYGNAGLQVCGVLRAAGFPLATLPTFANHVGAASPCMGIASITSF